MTFSKFSTSYTHNQWSLTPLIVNLTILILRLSMLLFTTASLAGDKLLTFNQQVNLFKTAKKVTVVLHGTPVSESERERNEGYNVELIRSGGCNFVSKDEKGVSELVTLLRHNHIKANPEINQYLPYFGVSVYFTYADGQETRLLFGRRYMGESTVDGQIATPLNATPVAVLANNSLYRDIYNWISSASEVQSNLKPEYHPDVFQYAVKRHIEWCARLMHANYYRNSPEQTCAIPESERPLSDVCEKGWQPSMQK